MTKLDIGGTLVGPGEPPYIIAEIGANHNGDMGLCKEMIASAKECGANAIKLQSWSKTSLVSRGEFDRAAVGAGDGETLEQMFERYQVTPDMHREVAEYSQQQGITFLSSVFAPEEVDLCVSIGMPAFKIASMDLNHLPLLKYVASTGKPVLLSTGMGTLAEIETALITLQDNGSGPVSVLHCISNYPPLDTEINLRNIELFADAFDVPIGFSDHTLGTSIPLAAIALGACVIEKHFTTDKTLEGWDHAMSADPPELAALVTEGKRVFGALGSRTRRVGEAEMEKRKSFRRRMIVKRDMSEGDRLSESDLEYKRPGNGIGPEETTYVVGRTLTRNISAEHELEWSELA